MRNWLSNDESSRELPPSLFSLGTLSLILVLLGGVLAGGSGVSLLLPDETGIPENTAPTVSPHAVKYSSDSALPTPSNTERGRATQWSLSPTSLPVTVGEGGRTLDTLTLHNDGSSSLKWSLDGEPSSSAGTEMLASVRKAVDSSLEPASRRMALQEAVRERGQVSVIAELDVSFTPETKLSRTEAWSQRQRIGAAQQTVRSRIESHARSVWQSKYAPLLVTEVNEEGLQRLWEHEAVTRVMEDKADPPHLATSTSVVGASDSWNLGFRGSRRAVAILDSGIDTSHPFLEQNVVAEACFSSTNQTRDTETLCPDETERQIGEGAACNPQLGDCGHGTHVAGIAAGQEQSQSGVAPAADLIAIQVFSAFHDSDDCSDLPPCTKAFVSDQIRALEYVYDLRYDYNIASVNMSLGGGRYSSFCDDNSRTFIVEQLRSVGIATVTSAGNSGYTSAVSAPACISSIIAVGSTQDGSDGTTLDAISSFSNSARMLDFWAPGESIESSVPGRYEDKSGTSMASPHIAGAWAVAKSRWPDASVEEVETRLAHAGVPVTDSRNGILRPRLEVHDALDEEGWLIVGPRSGTLSPGKSQTLTVLVDAEELPPGSHEESLTITSESSGTQTAEVTAEVDERAPAQADIHPGGLEENVRTGSRLEIQQSITNDTEPGGQPLQIEVFPPDYLSLDQISGEGVTVRGSWIKIEPQATATITYGFRKHVEELTIYDEEITFETNDPEATEIAVQVPQIAVASSRLNFGAVGLGESADQTFELKSVGSAPLTGSVELTSGEEHFTITDNAGPFELEAGESLIITVASEPAESDIHKGTVEITHDALNYEDAIEVELEVGPEETHLEPPYPNPLRSEATFEYSIPETMDVQLDVFNVLGQRVATLVQGEKSPGVHHVQWSGHSDRSRMASGAYFVRLQTEDEIRTERFTIVR